MSNGELLQIDPIELQFPFELKKQISCSLQLSNKSDNYVAFKVKTTNPKKYCVRPNTGVVLPRSSCHVTVTMQAQKEAPADMQCKDKFLLQSVVATPGATAKDITPEMAKGLILKLTEEKNSAIQQNNKLQQELSHETCRFTASIHLLKLSSYILYLYQVVEYSLKKEYQSWIDFQNIARISIPPEYVNGWQQRMHRDAGAEWTELLRETKAKIGQKERDYFHEPIGLFCFLRHLIIHYRTNVVMKYG